MSSKRRDDKAVFPVFVTFQQYVTAVPKVASTTSVDSSHDVKETEFRIETDASYKISLRDEVSLASTTACPGIRVPSAKTGVW